MKNKKITIYLLLPVTVVIWGVVAFSIVGKLNGDKSQQVEYFREIQVTEDINLRDSIVLIANYRDPFLGNSATRKSQAPKVKTSLHEKAFTDKRKTQKPVQWPEIIYGGVIINTQQDKNTGLVKLDGKEYLVHVDEQINGIVFLSIYKDSIRVEYLKHRKTIVKAQ